MRTLLPHLAGTVILLLTLSLSVAVAAQDEADPMAPAYFTFTTGEPADWAEGVVTHIDGVTTEIRGSTVVGVPVEASDSRASGLLAFADNTGAFSHGDDHFTTGVTSVRLVNDGGAWSGTGTGVVAYTEAMALSEDIPPTTELTVLVGEGGYEGLTLVMSASHDGHSEATWGVIVPADGMPPVPEPPGE